MKKDSNIYVVDFSKFSPYGFSDDAHKSLDMPQLNLAESYCGFIDFFEYFGRFSHAAHKYNLEDFPHTFSGILHAAMKKIK